MKVIIMIDKRSGINREIHTPYLNSDEAALYLGMSRSKFDIIAREIPHILDGRLKKYNSGDLDIWMEGKK